MNDQTTTASTREPLVVLVHGLAAHRILMLPLSWRFKRAGFRTKLFGYRSWFWSIEHHAARLERFLADLDADPSVETVHIVAHSMGGIVTRQALLNFRLKKLGRIVLLAAPNQGSPAARYLGYLLPFCKTLHQVTDRPHSFVRQLPEPTGTEIGIVAARSDRVIPEPNSHLATETDHTLIFSGHNGLLVRPTAARLAITFLQTGQFKKVSGTVFRG